MARQLGVIGVPSSMGAFAPGQERAPQALREAGLLDALAVAGVTVVDHGDASVRRWRPDRNAPFAQNLDAVVAVASETAERVRGTLAAGQIPLVLGGDCTVGIGTVAGNPLGTERVALLYFDLHPDLNLPVAPGPGAFDWTGMSHLLGEEGAAGSLAGVGPRVPMLAPDEVFLFAHNREGATPREREALDRLGLAGIVVEEVRRDPEGTAAAALARVEPICDRLVVHFDVDVIDFTDMPLSENTGRNGGLPFAAAMTALRVILASEKLSALTVTELNPEHGEANGATLRAFVAELAGALGSAPLLTH